MNKNTLIYFLFKADDPDFELITVLQTFKLVSPAPDPKYLASTLKSVSKCTAKGLKI